MSNSKRKPSRPGNSRRGRSGGSKWPYMLLGLLLLGGWYAFHHPAMVRRELRSLNGTMGNGAGRASSHRRRGEREAHIAGCGTERWAVKTLMDADAARINTHPRETTIENLISIPRPSSSAIPEDGRNPIEERVYQVHARLLRYKLEKDEDIHIVLASTRDPRITMVAEIPAGSCTTQRAVWTPVR